MFCLSDYLDLVTDFRPQSRLTMTQGLAVGWKAERVWMMPALANLFFRDVAGWKGGHSIWKHIKGTVHPFEELVPDSKRGKRRKGRGRKEKETSTF